ncbi:hypothetical protein FRC03_001799 [Tulasnella sp. 419]|nr:hypothetical protein FRC02_002045 [Tulasnella sp. 418]KAG8945148.1 hypothetical protein FRC03_001799 [Tulasnella sp. 419]
MDTLKLLPEEDNVKITPSLVVSRILNSRFSSILDPRNFNDAAQKALEAITMDTLTTMPNIFSNKFVAARISSIIHHPSSPIRLQHVVF